MINHFPYAWDPDHRFAIHAALEIKRPLLIRGEPGIGKSSLAKAAAQVLDRNFICEVVSARTEPNDLLWQFDAVGRLADAQCAGSLEHIGANSLDKDKYIAPGVLWWAYNNETARLQYVKCKGSVKPSGDDMREGLENDWVVLIDEIDKAESDVPNSLLEALAEGSFHVPYYHGDLVKIQENSNPLIIITTNEERTLPAAFLRRCLVLHMMFPDKNVESWLIERVRKHVRTDNTEMLRQAAEVIVKGRANSHGPHLPGLSEYIDLVKVLEAPPAHDGQNISWRDALDKIALFVTDKNSRQFS